MLIYSKHLKGAGTLREALFATKPLKKAGRQSGDEHFKLAQGKYFNMKKPQVHTQWSAETLQRCEKYCLLKYRLQKAKY